MERRQSKTKDRILATAISLLNERGLSNVTMRELSGELKMSPGNLTYHYPKWENLMDDVFESFKESMNSLYEYFPGDINEIASYIDRIYQLQMQYAFIFSDFYVFFQQFPKYSPTKVEFFVTRVKVMHDALKGIAALGYLYPESEEHNYDLLIKNTWLILSGWHGFSRLLDGNSYAFTKEDFFRSIWNIFVNHLTPEGKELVMESLKNLPKEN